MVVVHLDRHVAAVLEEAEADVALELVGAQHLGDGAGGLGAPHLELEEAVARGRVPLREEEVVLGLGVDVVDPPPVADDLDGGLQAGDGEGGGGRPGWRCQEGGRSEERDRGCDREKGPGAVTCRHLRGISRVWGAGFEPMGMYGVLCQ